MADDLARTLTAQRAAFAAAGAPSADERRADLRAIERLLKRHGTELAEAIRADFGNRSLHETRLMEVFSSIEAARYARRNVAAWMRPQRKSVAPYFAPGRARVVRQPLGVVGIIVPWNYPVALAIEPLIGAFAAGNRAMIKMSELTPRTGEVLARLLRDAFSTDRVSVHNGGADLGRAFAALPFDHLLFTGSTGVGRSIMHAAAGNLTPVTLELGGKSPAIVGADAPLGMAAARIMSGKCRNAGQTCIAPDYVMLPAGNTAKFIDEARHAVAARYPTLLANPDYTSIVSDAHYERLRALLADATNHGATLMPLHPSVRAGDPATRIIPPTIVMGATDEMRVMREEIFGPILPIVTYRALEDAIAYVNARPRPLALSYFGERRADIERILEQTHSGGVTINDVMLHYAQAALPFGGIGPSGMGAYHGRDGFETFSARKAVYEQPRRSALALLEPPYGVRFEAIVRALFR
ncbi:MAG: coniferyl aldehyde dehydrogenase [Candidatus Velthaea sp.]